MSQITEHRAGPADGQHLTRVFKALSSETRMKILYLLNDREYTVKELTANFHVAQPSISRHLSILSEAHLVNRRREGQRVFYGWRAGELSSSIEEFLGGFERSRVRRERRIREVPLPPRRAAVALRR